MHHAVPEPPVQNPLFHDLNVRELLSGASRLFRFAVDGVWADWFGLVTEKVNPILVKATLNFPNTAAQTSSDLTVTVAGADTDQYVEVVPPAALWLANVSWVAFVSAVNVVTVRLINFSSGAINPDSGEFLIIVRK